MLQDLSSLPMAPVSTFPTLVILLAGGALAPPPTGALGIAGARSTSLPASGESRAEGEGVMTGACSTRLPTGGESRAEGQGGDGVVEGGDGVEKG